MLFFFLGGGGFSGEWRQARSGVSVVRKTTRNGVRRGNARVNARENGLLGASRGGMEQKMVCWQAVFFTRFSLRACLALYARVMVAWETRKSSACSTRLFNRMKKLTEDRKIEVVNIYFEHTAYKLH